MVNAVGLKVDPEVSGLREISHFDLHHVRLQSNGVL